MSKLRVLVTHEESGTVTAALRDAGVDAWSNDILPTRGRFSQYHIQGDYKEVAHDGRWDVMIAHPVCTALANSGIKHLFNDMKKENGINLERWREMEEGAKSYRAVRDVPIEHKLIENPVMHGYAIKATRRGYAQFKHPYHFGDPFLKFTGFELINFPKLRNINCLTPPKPGTAEHKQWSACHRAAPGPNRARDRAVTYPGVAQAITNAVLELASMKVAA